MYGIFYGASLKDLIPVLLEAFIYLECWSYGSYYISIIYNVSVNSKAIGKEVSKLLTQEVSVALECQFHFLSNIWLAWEN